MGEAISQDIMTTYEFLSLIIAGVALLLSILIPTIQALFRHLRKTKLDIIPFDANPLTVLFNESGSYIEMKFSIVCTRNDCVIRTISASIMHNDTRTKIKRRWTFLKPINVSWVNAGFQKAQLNGATYVHPIRLTKDSVEPLFVEFGTDLNTSEDALILERDNVLAQLANELGNDAISLDDLKSKAAIAKLSDRFSEQLYWQEGSYELDLAIDFDANKSVSKAFYFELNKKDIIRLKENTVPIIFYAAPFAIAGVANLSCNTVTPALQVK